MKRTLPLPLPSLHQSRPRNVENCSRSLFGTAKAAAAATFVVTNHSAKDGLTTFARTRLPLCNRCNVVIGSPLSRVPFSTVPSASAQCNPPSPLLLLHPLPAEINVCPLSSYFVFVSFFHFCLPLFLSSHTTKSLRRENTVRIERTFFVERSEFFCSCFCKKYI